VNVSEAIDDRFKRWGAFLRAQNATPLCVLGLKRSTNELVVTMCEGISDDETEDMLAAALITFRKQRGG
jgi:hypothetical protein